MSERDEAFYQRNPEMRPGNRQTAEGYYQMLYKRFKLWGWPEDQARRVAAGKTEEWKQYQPKDGRS